MKKPQKENFRSTLFHISTTLCLNFTTLPCFSLTREDKRDWKCFCLEQGQKKSRLVFHSVRHFFLCHDLSEYFEKLFIEKKLKILLLLPLFSTQNKSCWRHSKKKSFCFIYSRARKMRGQRKGRQEENNKQIDVTKKISVFFADNEFIPENYFWPPTQFDGIAKNDNIYVESLKMFSEPGNGQKKPFS